jgi:hypothetical protein
MGTVTLVSVRAPTLAQGPVLAQAGMPDMNAVLQREGHDYVAATRALAVLEEFVRRLQPVERVQFARLMHGTAHAVAGYQP